MNRRYQLRHASSTTANAATYMTCPRKGKIKGVMWAARIDAVADNVTIETELSFSSIAQISSTDVRGVISGFGWACNLGAAGADHGSVNFFDGPMEIDVMPGDRIYYNVEVSGVLAAAVRVWIEIDEA